MPEVIYIAIVEYDHEGYSVLCAFREEYAARQFIAPMKEHRAKHPPYPPIESPSDGPEWTACHEALRKWEAAAPPGFERGDGYDVIEATLC